MSKALNRLTPVQINAAEPGTTLNDGGGLLYRATGKNRKTGKSTGKFVFKFTSPDLDYRAAQAAKGSKSIQREMGLGAYPATTLAAARAKAAAARDQIAKKLDPIEEERRADEETQHRAAQLTEAANAKAMTFGRYADEHFLPFALPGFTNKAHIQQWQATFKTHAKRMRNKPLSEITREDVLAVLKPIWADKVVTASRSRERIERLFSHAIQNGHYKGDNPASWQQFNATLPTPRKTPRHHPAMPLSQIAEFVSAIRAKQSDSMAALMIEWIILAACRTGEARFAVWSEIDLAERVWTIPAERMKMRRGHVVPITDRMAEILTEAKRRRTQDALPSDIVFVGGTGKALSEMAALMLMRGMEAYKGFTVHGFRATFKGWAGTKTEFPRELIEEQLAHQLGAVERAYMRQSAHERRRAMMEVWADVCAGENPAACEDNVVPLRKAGEAQ
ncbi:tyrosine-type recombinase/integrase [Pseudorhodobacter sp. W20_MBD10_FR17]|uniref:tyrosine-type recombinase/integrase n=1 Tax=Pseudorhodobacter sp. W20_MBD10_FR17 TaxID=3240266 RepID=UPI003F97FE5A